MTNLSTAEDAERQIGDLEEQLAAAEHRADTAEEQLRRVHRAVRAFKQRQLAAQQETAAAAFDVGRAKQPAAVERSWGVEDPTLDSRFQHFLDGEGTDDVARKWILEQT